MEQKTYAFVRSRTYYREYDYRLLTPITKIPTLVHRHFEKCVRNILSDSTKNEAEWDEPTWLFIKQDKYVLWGVACNNKIFSEDCYQEELANRPVRCFCGVVYVDIGEQSLKLPYNIQAFQPVFDCTIGQLWKERVAEMPDVPVSLGDAYEYITPAGWKEELNINPRICRLFPSLSNAKELLSACLSSSEDISMAIDVVDKDQVYDKKSSTAILNVVMRHGMSKIDLPIKQKCKMCGAWVDELVDGLCDDCRRKESVPKVEDTNVHIPPKKNIYTCVECGKQTEWINKKGLCFDCEEKRYRKKLIRYIIIGVSILLLFFVKMCYAGDKRQGETSLGGNIPSDSISHTSDSMFLSSQK